MWYVPASEPPRITFLQACLDRPVRWICALGMPAMIVFILFGSSLGPFFVGSTVLILRRFAFALLEFFYPACGLVLRYHANGD